jgi:putative MATE family efflux protein
MPDLSSSNGRFAYLTSGPVGPAVFRLAWPVVLSEAIHTLFHMVDIAWVGRLGAWATAAVSSSMFVLWTIFSLANLVGVGLTAQVSRAIGAQDRERAARATAQAVVFSFSLGIAVSVLMILFSERLFLAIGASPEVVHAGGAYLRIFAAGAPLFFLSITLGAAMRAAGDTRTPMIVTSIALGTNALLDPLLIYGWGPFPRLEVSGAALATIICQAGGGFALIVLAFRGHAGLPFQVRSLLRPEPATMLAQARIGAPYSLVGILFSVNYILFAAVAARFGDAAIAVVGISNRLESITYLGADGFAVAAATLVGQNLGAGRPARAERATWIASGLMGTAAAILTVLFLLFPRALFGVFTGEGEVVSIGVSYLRILALCQVATALEGVIGGAFVGAGDTVPPMVIHLVFAIVRPVMAIGLAVGTGLGMNGIALTITATCIVRAMVLVVIFRRGRWKDKGLPGDHPSILPPEDAPDLAV